MSLRFANVEFAQGTVSSLALHCITDVYDLNIHVRDYAKNAHESEPQTRIVYRSPFIVKICVNEHGKVSGITKKAC